jgi:hypothetical protein
MNALEMLLWPSRSHAAFVLVRTSSCRSRTVKHLFGIVSGAIACTVCVNVSGLFVGPLDPWPCLDTRTVVLTSWFSL